jgi:hypothetical protein
MGADPIRALYVANARGGHPLADMSMPMPGAPKEKGARLASDALFQLPDEDSNLVPSGVSYK